MPNCTDEPIRMGKVERRVVQAAFDGGDIVSDGDSLLLRQVDDRLGLTRMAAAALGDSRRRASVRHELRSLLAQRVYGLCCGWEDVSDHNTLRHDLAPRPPPHLITPPTAGLRRIHEISGLGPSSTCSRHVCTHHVGAPRPKPGTINSA